MPTRVKSNEKAKDEEETGKEESRTGDSLAMTIDGCQHGHHCPRYRPRRPPGRCAIYGSTRHYISQCTGPVKPKEDSNWQAEAEWHESTRENEEYEASKGKKGKGKRSKSKEKSKGKSTPRSITPRPTQSQTPRTDRPHHKSKPEARSCVADDFLFAMMSTKSKPTWRHATWNSADYMVCTVVEPQKKLPVFKPGKWSIAPRR